MSTVEVSTPGAPQSDKAERYRLSNLQGVLRLSMLMIESGDEHKILHLALSSVPSLGRCRSEGIALVGDWWRGLSAADRAEIVARFDPRSQSCAFALDRETAGLGVAGTAGDR